jgi:PST family polysaccharide transporter
MVVGQTILGDWFFQGVERMRLLTVVNAISKILFTVLLFVFISSPDDYLYVPLFNSIGYLLAGSVMLTLSLKYVKWQWPNFKNSKEFYHDSFQIFLSDICSQFTYAANGVILGLFAGDAAVGIFSAFDKLMLAARKMFLPICQAVYPYMTRKSISEKRQLMTRLIMGVFVIGITGVLFIVFLGDWIINLLFADPAISENIYLLKWMSVIVFFTGLSLLFTNLYAPSRKLFHQRLKVMASATIFNLILGFSLVPYLGITGTVVTTISTELLMVVVSAYFYGIDGRSTNKQSTLL